MLLHFQARQEGLELESYVTVIEKSSFCSHVCICNPPFDQTVETTVDYIELEHSTP